MRKIYLIAGILVLAGAIALVVYINKKPASSSSPETAQIEAVPDSNGQRPSSLTEPVPNVKPQPQLTPEESENKQHALNDFVTRSQVDKDFVAAAAVLEDMLQLMSPEEQKILKPMVDKLSGPALLEEYKKDLADAFNQSELERLATIHSDKEVVLFQEATKKAATPEGQKELAKHLQNFDIEKLPADRREYLQKLADTQMDAVNQGSLLGNMNETQKQEFQAMQDAMRNLAVAQMDAVLKDKSVQQLQHLSSMTGDSLYKRELSVRANVVMRNMMTVGQALEMDNID